MVKFLDVNIDKFKKLIFSSYVGYSHRGSNPLQRQTGYNLM